MTTRVVGPEAFSDEKKTIICWKGENFYRACDVFVSYLPEGGQSFCVKRKDHPGHIHEDFDGRTRDEDSYNFQFQGMPLPQAVFEALGAASMCWDSPERAGVFKSERAKAIGDQLMERILSNVPEEPSDSIEPIRRFQDRQAERRRQTALDWACGSLQGSGSSTDFIIKRAEEFEKYLKDG